MGTSKSLQVSKEPRLSVFRRWALEGSRSSDPEGGDVTKGRDMVFGTGGVGRSPSSPVGGQWVLPIAYLLKTQLFNFLGNMGYMSVKD